MKESIECIGVGVCNVVELSHRIRRIEKQTKHAADMIDGDGLIVFRRERLKPLY